MEERTFGDLGAGVTDDEMDLSLYHRERISSSKLLTGLWSIRDDRWDARSHLHRYNYENPLNLEIY